MQKLAKKCIKEGERCQVSAHLSRTLVKRLEKMAKVSHRTLSGQIAFLLERGLTNLSIEEQELAFSPKRFDKPKR